MNLIVSIAQSRFADALLESTIKYEPDSSDQRAKKLFSCVQLLRFDLNIGPARPNSWKT
jgi:hypothetical protein